METLLAFSATAAAGLLVAACAGLWRIYGEVKGLSALLKAHKEDTDRRLTRLEGMPPGWPPPNQRRTG